MSRRQVPDATTGTVSLGRRKISLACCALDKLSPHFACLAIVGSSAHRAQIIPEHFEAAGPAETKFGLLMGDHLGKCLEELVIVIADMAKHNCARFHWAW